MTARTKEERRAHESECRVALDKILTALDPLSKEFRHRVITSACSFYGLEWRGKDHKEHEGDNDCG